MLKLLISAGHITKRKKKDQPLNNTKLETATVQVWKHVEKVSKCSKKQQHSSDYSYLKWKGKGKMELPGNNKGNTGTDTRYYSLSLIHI